MQRFVTAATAVALALAAAAAHAQAASDQTVSVTVSKAQLTSATGYVDLKQQIAAKADAYCRAHPVDRTVAACRQDIVQQLQVQAEDRRQAMLATPNAYAQAQR